MNMRSARKLMIAAIATYVLWIAALVVMAVVSASRPGAATIDRPAIPAGSLPEIE